MSESRYAVREFVRDRIEGYAVAHPDSGELVSNRSFENGYCEQPLCWPHDEATGIAAKLTEATGVVWAVELAPNPCPNCGRVIWADDRDFCYPQTRERTKWRAGCNEHDFGCGHEITAETYEEVMRRWNAGA